MEEQLVATWAQVYVSGAVGFGQLLLIAWGLWQMRVSSKERNRQLDIMEAAQRRQGEVLAELLRRSA